MNIIFMGTPDFAVPSLKVLLTSRHRISAVVTVPDKPQGRGLKVSESAIKKFASENNIKALQPKNLKDEGFINEVKSLNPDLIVVVAFRLLPKELYAIPKYGSINLHASLLPKYRGAAPINWAIINGEKETGVTTFFLQDKVDTGNIIMQNYCDITNEDDAGTMHDKLMELGALTLYSTVNLIEQAGGKPTTEQQNDNESTPAPKIFKEDCLIDWSELAKNVYNFIRGHSPYPAAYTIYKDKMIRIYSTRKTERPAEDKPGTFTVRRNGIFAATSDEILEILELQLEGKKRMNAKEFLNGNRNLFE